MDVPNVRKTEYPLLDIDDGYMSLMNDDGSSKDDVKIPEGDLGKQIMEGFESGKELLVTVVTAMGEEHCLAFKEAPK
jgi:translation initiation factor 5A